jgi:hypothetical protein
MNIFDTEYFPLPDTLIGKMIAPYFDQIRRRTFLEPSAGSGSMLEQRSYYWDKRKPLYCCEVNPELVLMYDFDLIIMTPPFSNGEEHLLKAWDILNGGDIVC